MTLLKYAIPALVAAVLVFIASGSALATNHCSPHDEMMQTLAVDYGETTVIEAIDSAGNVLEVTGNPISESWTVLLTTPAVEKLTCFASSGFGYEVAKEMVEGEPLSIFVGLAGNGYLKMVAVGEFEWRIDLIFIDDQPDQIGVASGPSYEILESAGDIKGNPQFLPPWVGEEI